MMIAMIVKMMIGRPRPRLRPAAIPAVLPPLLSLVSPSPPGVPVVTTVIDGELEVVVVTDTELVVLILLLLIVMVIEELFMVVELVTATLVELIATVELMAMLEVVLSIVVVVAVKIGGHVHEVVMDVDMLSFIALLLTSIIIPLPDSLPDPSSPVIFVPLMFEMFGHMEHIVILILSAADATITISEHVRHDSKSNAQDVFVLNIA